MAYTSGSSNYPNNYDLTPTGSTTATVSYVLDQTRDALTGVISQSGDAVIALQINSIYTILQTLEETIGINPEGAYDTVVERLDYMTISGSSAFVPTTGGSMTGDLVIDDGSSVSVNDLATSGLTWIALDDTTINTSGNLSASVSGNITIDAIGNKSTTINTNDFNVNSNVTSIVSTGSVYVSGGSVTIGSTGSVSIENSLVPSTGGTYDLGSTGSIFDTIFVGNIVSTGLDATYVNTTGGNITGDVTLSGASVLNYDSGVNFLGSQNAPFSGVYARDAYFTNVSGLSPITLHSNMEFPDSGTINIGTIANPIGTIYADSVLPGIDSSGLVSITGDTMTGDLTIASGASLVIDSGSAVSIGSGATLLPVASGSNDLGSASNPLNDIYTNSMNGVAAANLVFNHPLSGTVDGSNKTFTFDNAPSLGNAMVYVSGVLVRPTDDYTISSSTLTFTPSFYGPGTRPVAGFYIY